MASYEDRAFVSDGIFVNDVETKLMVEYDYDLLCFGYARQHIDAQISLTDIVSVICTYVAIFPHECRLHFEGSLQRPQTNPGWGVLSPRESNYCKHLALIRNGLSNTDELLNSIKNSQNDNNSIDSNDTIIPKKAVKLDKISIRMRNQIDGTKQSLIGQYGIIAVNKNDNRSDENIKNSKAQFEVPITALSIRSVRSPAAPSGRSTNRHLGWDTVEEPKKFFAFPSFGDDEEEDEEEDDNADDNSGNPDAGKKQKKKKDEPISTEFEKFFFNRTVNNSESLDALIERYNEYYCGEEDSKENKKMDAKTKSKSKIYSFWIDATKRYDELKMFDVTVPCSLFELDMSKVESQQNTHSILGTRNASGSNSKGKKQSKFKKMFGKNQTKKNSQNERKGEEKKDHNGDNSSDEVQWCVYKSGLSKLNNNTNKNTNKNQNVQGYWVRFLHSSQLNNLSIMLSPNTRQQLVLELVENIYSLENKSEKFKSDFKHHLHSDLKNININLDCCWMLRQKRKNLSRYDDRKDLMLIEFGNKIDCDNFGKFVKVVCGKEPQINTDSLIDYSGRLKLSRNSGKYSTSGFRRVDPLLAGRNNRNDDKTNSKVKKKRRNSVCFGYNCGYDNVIRKYALNMANQIGSYAYKEEFDQNPNEVMFEFEFEYEKNGKDKNVNMNDDDNDNNILRLDSNENENENENGSKCLFSFVLKDLISLNVMDIVMEHVEFGHDAFSFDNRRMVLNLEKYDYYFVIANPTRTRAGFEPMYKIKLK